MKIIEQEMLLAHEDELNNFDGEVDKLVIPKPKFSKEILNLRHVLNNVIRSKKYSEAEEITSKLEIMEYNEIEKWNK